MKLTDSQVTFLYKAVSFLVGFIGLILIIINL
jgi:hypothetical protein